MIIPKSIEYEIEYHFFAYAEEKKQIENLERDIAEAITPNLDGIGGSSGKSDPTAQKAAQIERETKELRMWVDVVEQTFKHFSGQPEEEYMNLAYKQGITTWQIIRNEMYVSHATVFRRRQAILTYAALVAANKNLISF